MSYGLMVIGVNLGYLLLALFVGIFLAKFFKRVSYFRKLPTSLLATVLFLLIFFAPFYDLLIQKGIKTYYEVFDKTYAKIYAYPEKDSEGRVESVARDRLFGTMGVRRIDTDSNYLKRIYPWIRNFTENYFEGALEKKENVDLGYARVYLNKKPITYEKISSPKDFKARYQVLTKINKHWFYKEMKTSFWDKKKNKLLAQTLEIAFPVENQKNKFRYKYLHQHGANGGGGIFIDDISGFDYDVYQKLFINKNLKEGNIK